MISYYSTHNRKTRKWLKKLFMWILEVTEVNAHILYVLSRPEQPKKIPFSTFKDSLVAQLENKAAEITPAAIATAPSHRTKANVANAVERLQGNKHLVDYDGTDARSSVSPRKGTWFELSKISIRKSLILAYLWTRKASYKDAIHETSGALFQEKNTSSETVADCYSYCREVCTEALLSSRAEGTPTQIGGPNLTVEVDEAKFGKRKYHRGRVVEGQWVLGGICRETRDCFLVPVEDRGADTLLSIIRERVAPGTTVLTDEWRAYSRLTEFGFTHQTVNHSQNFVNPETGTNTNLIENTWWCIKRSLPSTHTRKEQFASHLAEFIWRKKNQNRECLFTAFMEDVVAVYPGL
ncbi:hypothetical protein EGW08_018710 [Elysia chlorotica]|uniref:ISXO2-like transposase domain-containing protein n=1 Tax=Elysia chlorotica TaxID=188477 RepID=A0A433SW89_ELYCH|nr:hypothetical protein EGW08_018710 [Elysia chlorotica]